MQDKTEGAARIKEGIYSTKSTSLTFFGSTRGYDSCGSLDLFKDLTRKVNNILQFIEEPLRKEREMESLSVECKSAVHTLFGWIRISVDSMLDYLDCDRERTDSTQQLKVLLGDLVCPFLSRCLLTGVNYNYPLVLPHEEF